MRLKANLNFLILIYVAAIGFFIDNMHPLAQTTNHLSGPEIMAKFIEGTGGQAAYDKISNRITWSTLDIEDQGMKIAITTYAAKPNKILIVMDIPGVGKVERGMSEGVVWERTPKGAAIKTGREMQEGLRDALFDKFAYWRKAFDDVKYAGADTVDGHPCYIAIMTPRIGDPLTVHFDQTSGLIREIDFAVNPKSGPVSVSLTMSDYRRVDGILTAFETRLRMMDEERVMIVDSVKQNTNIPDSLFSLPSDVRALMNVKK
ncbi:conserved hypothetical protein [Candidatus Zixiibacteriota bacterium]|nr:conserved hypothetical protein [candidate division Zixibacteria bacterium]